MSTNSSGQSEQPTNVNRAKLEQWNAQHFQVTIRRRVPLNAMPKARQYPRANEWNQKISDAGQLPLEEREAKYGEVVAELQEQRKFLKAEKLLGEDKKTEIESDFAAAEQQLIAAIKKTKADNSPEAHKKTIQQLSVRKMQMRSRLDQFSFGNKTPQGSQATLNQSWNAVQFGKLDAKVLRTAKNQLDQLEKDFNKVRKESIDGFKNSLADLENTPTQGMPAPTGQLPNNYVRPVIGGAGRAYLTRPIAEQEFGTSNDRHAINPQVSQEINHLRDMGLAAEVNLTSGGKNLKGNFFAGKGDNLKTKGYKPDTSKPVVLLLTGSGGSAQDQGLDMAKFYAEQECGVLSVNYRGFGDSDHEFPSEKSMHEDSQAMLEYLLSMGYTMDKIVLHGFSLGGPMAANLEASNKQANPNTKFMGAVADRPMTSSSDATSAAVSAMGAPGFLAGAMGKLAKVSAGKMNAKGKLRNDVDTTTPRVVTSDQSEHLGENARKLRNRMQGDPGGTNVAGQDSGADHMDSKAMLDRNRGDLVNMLHQGGHDPSGNPDPHFDVVKDLAKHLKSLDQCTKFCSQITGLQRQLAKAPIRTDAVRTLRKAEYLLGTLTDLEASGFFATAAGQPLWSTHKFQKNTSLPALKSYLETLIDGIEQGDVTEAQPLDQQTMTTNVGTARTNQKGDLKAKFDGKLNQMSSDTSRSLDNDITKQFLIVMERMRAFQAEAGATNTTTAQLIEMLAALQNSAQNCLNKFADKYNGDSQDSGSNTTNKCRDHAKEIVGFAEEQIALYNGYGLIDELNQGRSVRDLKMAEVAVLVKMVRNRDLASGVQAVADQHLNAYYAYQESFGGDPFDNVQEMVEDTSAKLYQLQGLKRSVAAALDGGSKEGDFTFFDKMIDGQPLFVYKVDAAEFQTLALSKSTTGKFKKVSSNGKKAVKYDGGPDPATLLKGLQSTGWNTGDLKPAVSVIKKS